VRYLVPGGWVSKRPVLEVARCRRVPMSDERTDPVVERAPGEADAAETGRATADERATLLAEVESLRGQLLRLRADTDNYRKRLDRVMAEEVRRARADVLQDALEVADNLERSLAAIAGTDAGGGLLDGVRMTLSKLRDALTRRGVQLIAVDAAFDPRWHEAVDTVPAADVPAGTIVDVVRSGYRLGDDVLRPARVRVAVGPPG